MGTVTQVGSSDGLGRYYTLEFVSQLLVDQLGGLEPQRVLDLGSGAGSLSLAAMQRWQQAEFLTVDVDRRASADLNSGVGRLKMRPRHQHVFADALSRDLPDVLTPISLAPDVGLCNPPFIAPKWRRGFGKILEDAGFSSCLPFLSDVDAALIFLAQNLRLLQKGGTLGIILPDSLVSGERYQGFRRTLLQRYRLERAIRLPRRSFVNTDALAHILIVSKRRPLTEGIAVFRFDANRRLSHKLVLEMDQAIERLDFAFHSQGDSLLDGSSVGEPLQRYVIDLRRGRFSSYEVKHAGLHIFHTTDMTGERHGLWCDLRAFGRDLTSNDGNRTQTAAPGDILIARVGRNLATKVVGVGAGYPAISDCVLRLRPLPKLRYSILAQLASQRGQAWLESRAYGVGAQILKKSDLLSFPIFN